VPEATGDRPAEPAPEPPRAKRAKFTASPDAASRGRGKRRSESSQPAKVPRQLIQQL